MLSTMRIMLGIMSLLLVATACWSQDFSGFQVVSTHSPSALKPNESKILEHANYILNHAVDPLDPTRNDSMGAVLLWMMNTPDYTFFIDETIVPVIKKDEEILAIYM